MTPSHVNAAIPSVPDGAPSWVYVVAVAAAVIVAAITGAPTIIEKWRGSTSPKDNKPDPLPALTHPAIPAAAAAEPPTDTLRSMIVDLQARLTRSENREDDMQERVVKLTGDLATAHARIASLERQIEVMTMDRRSG